MRATATAATARSTHGPFDEDDLDPEHAAAERVDFGAVRVPVPRGGEVSVEPEDGRLQAVHVMLPAGRLSVSALAAPRTGGLWPDLAAEIDESLREGGATVRSFTGEWGRELHARTGDASSLFVGVDGPRWMLYGVATGPTGSARELDAALRRDAPRDGGGARTLPVPRPDRAPAHGSRAPVSARADRDAGPGARATDAGRTRTGAATARPPGRPGGRTHDHHAWCPTVWTPCRTESPAGSPNRWRTQTGSAPRPAVRPAVPSFAAATPWRTRIQRCRRARRRMRPRSE